VVGHRRGRGNRDQVRTLPTPISTAAARRGPTIRGRLTRILALPLVAVVVLLAVVVVGDVGSYQAATETTRSVALGLEVQDLVEELQHERGLTTGFLGGDAWYETELPPARETVDKERGVLQGLAAGTVTGTAAVREALSQLDGLDGIRKQVDSKKMTRAAAYRYFTTRIAAFTDVDLGLDRSDDPTLRRAVNALDALSQIKETTAQERALLNGVFSAGGFEGTEYVQYVGVHAAQLAALDRYRRLATGLHEFLLNQTLDTGAAREAASFEQRALAAGDGRRLVVDPQSWWSAHTTVLDDMRKVQESMGGYISRRASSLQSQASMRLLGLLALTLLCVTGAVILVIAAARSITRPLAALATEADDLASRRLPDAMARVQSAQEAEIPRPPEPVMVPARSSAEIHSVAEALERVQDTAYSLATEQAMLRRSTTESLANLGRRNQNLLRRQLGFITQLEREETDPNGLANLFELDHLATRMRRNAESLLVLVGEATPRTWSAPLPIADVLRAAVSEVEEYRRVSLRRVDEAFVGGQFVAGIAHMLAELVENGLAFSPPDVDVEIQGRLLPGRYLIAITDQGVGMDEGELIRANSRLRGEGSFFASPARYLGHYVVGHLARHMNVEVQITPSPVTGVTARVILPSTVLAAAPALNPPTPATAKAGAGNGNGAATGTASVPRATGDARPTSHRQDGTPRPTTTAYDAPVFPAHAFEQPVAEQPVTPPAFEPPVFPPPVVEPRVEPARTAEPTHRAEPVVEPLRAIDAAAAAPPPGEHGEWAGTWNSGESLRRRGVGVGVVEYMTVGPPAGSFGGGNDPERTPNGLLKRVPRSRARTVPSARTPTDATPADTPSTTETGPAGGYPYEATPAEISARLASLRAGVARHENDSAERGSRAR
jgi:hypothetical protein